MSLLKSNFVSPSTLASYIFIFFSFFFPQKSKQRHEIQSLSCERGIIKTFWDQKHPCDPWWSGKKTTFPCQFSHQSKSLKVAWPFLLFWNRETYPIAPHTHSVSSHKSAAITSFPHPSGLAHQCHRTSPLNTSTTQDHSFSWWPTNVTCKQEGKNCCDQIKIRSSLLAFWKKKRLNINLILAWNKTVRLLKKKDKQKWDQNYYSIKIKPKTAMFNQAQ